MLEHSPRRRTRLLRNAYGSTPAEAFMISAILTILVTRLYLHLAGYPQVGGASLHIAHALYGGALMMFALLIGWMFLGFGVRILCVLLGGVGFGLFLDEVGKFVTKDNDYFYGPSAEIMYVLVAVLLVLARIVRELRTPSLDESLANAAIIAAEGITRGLPVHRREWAMRMVERAEAQGADPVTTASITALLEHAHPTSDRLLTLQQFSTRLIPRFFKSPRWIPVIGWVLVASSFIGAVLGVLGAIFGGIYYADDNTTLKLDGLSVSGVILLVSAFLTLTLALPAMVARRRTAELWPLRWLRNAALVFTMLNALVDFATDGFGALVNLAIGLFALAMLTHQLNLRIAQEGRHDAALRAARKGAPAL